MRFVRLTAGFASLFLFSAVACSDSSSSSNGANDADGSLSDAANFSDGAIGSDSGSSQNPDGSSMSCGAAMVGANSDFKGYRMFPANHPINTAIDTLSVSAHSADWLANCSPSQPHLQLFNGMPYNIVPASTPPVTATSLEYNSKPYPNPWPFPGNASIEGVDAAAPGDHHCLAFDVGDCKLYEVYNFVWGAGGTSFTGVSGTVWDTTINDPGNGSGSDAAGLPITPILIRYDELFTLAAINHALRLTCEFSEQGHIAPARASASSSAGQGTPADPHDLTYPPMGMRVRLKASFDPTAHGYPAWIVTILNTLKKYGMLLADNGGSGTPLVLCGADGDALGNATIDDAYMLKQITTDDLEVVDTGEPTQD